MIAGWLAVDAPGILPHSAFVSTITIAVPDSLDASRTERMNAVARVLQRFGEANLIR
jgi:hypothetical protein